MTDRPVWRNDSAGSSGPVSTDAATPSSPHRPRPGKIWLGMAYAAPVVPFAMLATPALSIVPPIYAKHGALGLGAMGLALVIARSFDALIDPVIGALSDRTAHKRGGRLLWVHGAIVLAMIASYFWLDVGPDAGFGYFLGWAMCLGLAWSMFEIPHRAILADAMHDVAGQTRFAAWRTGAIQLGMITCMLTLQSAGDTATLGPDALRLLAVVVIPLLLITAVLFQLGTRSIIRPEQPTLPVVRESLARNAGHALRNAPMRRLLTIIALQGSATGMSSALYFFYMDTVLGLVGIIPLVALLAGGTGVIAAWGWYPAIARLGNARTLAVGNAGIALILILFCIISPGTYTAAAMMALFILSALCATGMEIAIVSETARIVQHDHHASGRNHAALFYSLERFVTQICIAIGAAVALTIVHAGGFNPSTTNDWIGTVLLLLSFALLPALLHLLAGWRSLRLSSTATP